MSLCYYSKIAKNVNIQVKYKYVKIDLNNYLIIDEMY